VSVVARASGPANTSLCRLLQVGYQVRSVVRIGQTGVRHAVADDDLLRIGDELVEGLRRPGESALVENIDMAQRVIDELRQSGIRIALDDFGTGYATLAQLQTLNLDKIKIDRRFVDRVVKDRESLVIVRAILGLASGFGLTTTAEGIEEDEQRCCGAYWWERWS